MLIHDDPGVVLYDAEPLAAFQGGGFFALLGGLMTLYFRRSIRRSTVSSRQEVPSNKPRLLCLASLALFSFASVLGLFLGIQGSRSYGGGLFEGVVASAADLQLPGGPFGATVFTLNAFIFLPWISGLLLWLKSFSMIVAGSRLAGVVGLVYAIGSLVVGLLLALSYEPILVSFLTTATLSIPLIAGGLHLMSQPQKTLG